MPIENRWRVVAKTDFPECLKGRHEEDKAFKPILDSPENFANFETEDRLVFFLSEGVRCLAIPDVKINGQPIRETIIHQGRSILAHLGSNKTTTPLRGPEQVWWKTIIQDITDYGKSCQTYAVSKSPTEKPKGLFKKMLVPTRPWQYVRVSIDFVGPLPESSNRNGSFDMICVVIDLLTAMTHLVPTCQTYKAMDMAEVIFDANHKLPEGNRGNRRSRLAVQHAVDCR
jgi:hypothetical protein